MKIMAFSDNEEFPIRKWGILLPILRKNYLQNTAGQYRAREPVRERPVGEDKGGREHARKQTRPRTLGR